MSFVDIARTAALVLAPMVAQGVLIRRRRSARLATALDVDGVAVRTLARLRARYGEAPLVLRLPGRRLVIPLSSVDAAEVLASTPVPYSAASREKRAALRHFEPHIVLVSTGRERAYRRRFNEQVLETHQPRHHHAERFAALIREELAPLAGRATMGWDDFNDVWQRIVRRIVLGDRAADDTELTAMLLRLRKRGNWAYLRRRNERLRRRFQERLDQYVRAAEPGSLAAMASHGLADPGLDPAGQLPHWLFAYDAAGITLFRTLAVAATRPGLASELSAGDPAFAQACVQETLRLWPTTLVLLRQVTDETTLEGTTLPAGTTVALISIWLHRDPRRPDADDYHPSAWRDGERAVDPGIVPFSDGPARCPGESLVLQTAGVALTALSTTRWSLIEPSFRSDLSLPPMLNHYAIRLRNRG